MKNTNLLVDNNHEIKSTEFLAKGTQILLYDNTVKNIEDIKEGDILFSFNMSTNKLEFVPVTSIERKERLLYKLEKPYPFYIETSQLFYRRGVGHKRKILPFKEFKRKDATYFTSTYKTEILHIQDMSKYTLGYLKGFTDGDGTVIKNKKSKIENAYICRLYQKDSVKDILLEIRDLLKTYLDIIVPIPYLNTYNKTLMRVLCINKAKDVDKFIKETSFEENNFLQIIY